MKIIDKLILKIIMNTRNYLEELKSCLSTTNLIKSFPFMILVIFRSFTFKWFKGNIFYRQRINRKENLRKLPVKTHCMFFRKI